MCLSPNGKAKPKKKNPSKKATGVAAARSEFPLSTNVSSPVQEYSRRRNRRGKESAPARVQEEEAASDDDFIDNREIVETDDDSSDGFALASEKGKSKVRSKRVLGPPITVDERFDALNSIHKMVVDDFVVNAKEEGKRVSRDSPK